MVDKTIAQDVLKDTFLDFWRNIAFYEDEKSSIFTWAMQLATTRANNYQKLNAPDPMVTTNN